LFPADFQAIFPKVFGSRVLIANIFMPKTRLYIECPNCHMQYLLKEIALTYSNGAYIENVAGAPEWQRLLCPCRPDTPYKFKLSETMRLKVFSADESEHTHFLTNKKKPPVSGS
jgi:hypothetical protein